MSIIEKLKTEANNRVIVNELIHLAARQGQNINNEMACLYSWNNASICDHEDERDPVEMQRASLLRAAGYIESLVAILERIQVEMKP